jgi:hypothetical protein
MEEFPEVPCKRCERLNGLLNTVPLYSLRLVLALRHTDGLLHHLGRLVGVICHFERWRRQALLPRQRASGTLSLRV